MKKTLLNPKKFSGKKVLITGGLGFIGSNLAIRLVKLGARVTLLDSMLPLYGGNLFNIQSIQKRVKINFADIRDQSAMNYMVKDQDYIFHLAGQLSHVDSITDPFTDVYINIKGTLCVLEACRRFNPKAKILFAGTRGEYGPSVKLPVNESAPTNPKGMYAITNLTAEKMVLMYHEVHGVQGCCFRITNTYGPRHQMKHNRYGVVNWFIRTLLDQKPITLMGDGKILRDFLYIDDLVDAFLAAALQPQAYGEVFNVGSGEAIDFSDLARTMLRVAKRGKVKFVPFSQERKQLEPGDFYMDISKIFDYTGWSPKVSLSNGLAKTISFYRKYQKHYWNPSHV